MSEAIDREKYPYADEFPPVTDDIRSAIKKALPPKSELRTMDLEVPEGVTLLLTPATQAEWEKMSNATDEQKQQAASDLIYACIKYPDRAKVVDMLERWPALPNTLISEIMRISGLSSRVRAKKS